MNKVMNLTGKSTTLNVGPQRGIDEAIPNGTTTSTATEDRRSLPTRARRDVNPAMSLVEARFGIDLPPLSANRTAMEML